MGKKTKRNTRQQKKYETRQALQADRHKLYELSVQNVENEIEFLDKTYRILRGRPARSLREDFAGTTAAACEWVRSAPDREAWAVDFDPEVLEWGRQHRIGALDEDQQARIHVLPNDVLEAETPLVDMLIAFNFSYWTFKTRDELRAYFQAARRGLERDGVFFIDAFGGSEAYEETEEETELDDFTYVWDQHYFDPVTAAMHCYIHFHFPDGSKLRKAFSYEWRMWTLPELQELLAEAGFRRATVYWEGTDEDGEGDGEFTPVEHGESDPAWIAYIVAEV